MLIAACSLYVIVTGSLGVYTVPLAIPLAGTVYSCVDVYTHCGMLCRRQAYNIMTVLLATCRTGSHAIPARRPV